METGRNSLSGKLTPRWANLLWCASSFLGGLDQDTRSTRGEERAEVIVAEGLAGME